MPPTPIAGKIPCTQAANSNGGTCTSRGNVERVPPLLLARLPKPPTAMAGHAQALPMWNVSCHCFLRDQHQAVPPLLPARQVHLARALFVSHLQARLNHLLATICRLGLNHLQARSCSCARRVTCIQCGLQSAWLNGQTTSCNFGLVTCML